MPKSKRAEKYFTIFLIVVIVTVISVFGGTFVAKQLYPNKYRETVEKNCALYNVPESLVFAVIYTESGFDSAAISRANAKGLMQITNETFDWIRFKMGDTAELYYDDIYDTDINIKYGVYMLKLMYEEFGNWDYALAAYNAGRTRVKQWLNNIEISPNGNLDIKKIPYGETRRYVEKVRKSERIYKILYY